MADKPTDPPNPEHGWGQLLPKFFKEPTMIVNHAANGRSTRSFITEGRWQKLVEALQPGDFVITSLRTTTRRYSPTPAGNSRRT